MRTVFLVVGMGVGLLSCGGLKETRWNDKVAKVSCKNLKRCDPITFFRDYNNVKTCEASTQFPDYSGCDYDPKAAADCLSAMNWNCKKIGRRYDDLIARCDAVWTCGTPPPTGDTGQPL